MVTRILIHGETVHHYYYTLWPILNQSFDQKVSTWFMRPYESIDSRTRFWKLQYSEFDGPTSVPTDYERRNDEEFWKAEAEEHRRINFWKTQGDIMGSAM